MRHNNKIWEIDWNPILQKMQVEAGQSLPSYPGDLKTALLNHVGLIDQAVGEASYQLAAEIAQTSTDCDPEITYWFSQLIFLLCLNSQTSKPAHFSLPVHLEPVSVQPLSGK